MSPDAGARTRYVGRRTERHARVTSTNDVARDLAAAGAPEGTAVVADEQTGGRGRLGRPWASPPGGLWLSLVLRPRLPAHEAPRLGLAVGVAVARAIERATGVAVRLKWPNDLMVGDRKVGGVLVEAPAEAGWAVAGIGVNANVSLEALPPEVRERATTLEAAAGRPVDRDALLGEIFAEVEKAYEVLRGDGFATILRWWRDRAASLGERVTVRVPGEVVAGVAEGIDEDGALLVRLDDGSVRRLLAGEIG